jgi:hypothetical protein
LAEDFLMADFTTIPLSNFEPEKPIRSVDILSLKNNQDAITQGSDGAPRVVANALQQTSVESLWSQTQFANMVASINNTENQGISKIGTIMQGGLKDFVLGPGATDVAFGGTKDGASINWAYGVRIIATNFRPAISNYTSPTFPGTWKALGYYDAFSSGSIGVSLGTTIFIRVL